MAIALAVPLVAHADSAAELEAKGEEFAKAGRYSDAIDAFKAADRLEPRASHVCLIALAYTRRELWPQAEIFLDKCHSRADANDPLPEWVPLADRQLAERLASANVAAVTIAVDPDVPAALAVSSFAPDETFAPRTIHLAPGRHVISVAAEGYEPAQETVDVVDRSDKRVVIALRKRLVVVVVPPRPPPPVHVEVTERSRVPLFVVGAGGALGLAGLATHLFALEPVRTKLADAKTQTDYAMYSHSFDVRREATLALYGAGALAIAAGVVLHYTVFAHAEVSVALAPGGATMAIGWRR